MDQNDNSLLGFDIEPSSNNIIKVLGVGGGGGNAVNHMFEYGIHDVDFVLANTDNQALNASQVPVKIQLGSSLTQGLGAGNNPEKGFDAATESIEEIKAVLGGAEHTKMLFITAGMGGGTGTGAAPVIAKEAKESGILTVAIVTVPFRFEGPKRVAQAKEGLLKLKSNVDSLLVIDNQKILKMYGKLNINEAFAKADDVLTMAAKGIAEIITVGGKVNVDFADVKSVMQDSGIALMGNGQAEGDNRAEVAIKEALNSPLLNNNNILGAKNLLINISTSSDQNYQPSLDEVAFINEFIQDASGNRANLIWGQSTDNSLGARLSATIIATGFDEEDFVNPFETEEGYRPVSNFKTTSNPVVEKKEEKTAPQAADSQDNPVHSTGDEVDLGEVDESIYDEPQEEDEPQITNNDFRACDFSSVDIEGYDREPAYLRKGIKLNIGNYTDPKCTRTSLNEV